MSVLDMKIKKTTPLSFFFVGLLIIMPFMDVLSGLGAEGGGYGKFVRIVLLCLVMVVIVLSFYRDALKPELLAFVSFIGFAAISLVINGLKIENFIFTLKLIFIPAFYLATCYLLRCRLIDRRAIIIGLWLSTLVIVALCYALYFLGIGMGTYSGVGFKGGFHAGNELAIYLVVVYPVVLVFALRHGKMYWLPVLPTALLMILLGTKGSMVGLVIESILVSVFWAKIHNKSIIKNITLVLTILILFAIFIFVQFGEIIATIVINRWVYFFDTVDIYTFIFSHRNIYLQDAWEYFSQRDNLWTLMFGHGFISTQPHYLHIIEMDIFDVYFSLGFAGLFSLFVLWMFMFYRVYKRWRIEKGSESIMFVVSIPVLVIQMIFGGHVVYSTLAGMVLAIAMAIGTAMECLAPRGEYHKIPITMHSEIS